MNHLQIMRSGSRGLVFDSSTGRISVLNEVGILIVEGIQSGLSPDELTAAISNRFGAPTDTAERDLVDFMSQLRCTKMVRSS